MSFTWYHEAKSFTSKAETDPLGGREGECKTSLVAWTEVTKKNAYGGLGFGISCQVKLEVID